MVQSTCEKCAGPALTIDELNERSKSLGMFVQSDGTIIAPAGAWLKIKKSSSASSPST